MSSGEIADFVGVDIGATSELLALVTAAARRPGGWSVPVRIMCGNGHDSGSALRFRAADHGGITLGAMRGARISQPLGDYGMPWRLTCHCGRRSQFRADGWMEEQALEALGRWLASGRKGPARFVWT